MPAPSISGFGFYSPSTDYGSYDEGFDLTPGPQTGQGPYGTVPGPIGIPPNYWQQMKGIYPVAGQAGQAASVIGSQLAGQLSPETIAALQRNAAQFGAASGMPLSQFVGNQGLVQLGQNVEATQQAGLTNYQNMLRALSGTLTPQELSAQIAARNATMAAAPDPRAAAEQQMADWMSKFNLAQRAATAPSGGRGMVMSPSVSWPNAPLNYPATPGGGIGPIPVYPGTAAPDTYDPTGAYERWAAATGYPITTGFGTPGVTDWTPEELSQLGWNPEDWYGTATPTTGGYTYMGTPEGETLGLDLPGYEYDPYADIAQIDYSGTYYPDWSSEYIDPETGGWY